MDTYKKTKELHLCYLHIFLRKFPSYLVNAIRCLLLKAKIYKELQFSTRSFACIGKSKCVYVLAHNNRHISETSCILMPHMENTKACIGCYFLFSRVFSREGRIDRSS